MDKLKDGAVSAGKYFRTFCRWVLLSVVTGLVCGLVGSAFHLTVDFATRFRSLHPWLLFLLPVGGLAVAFIYRVSKMEGEGTNNIIDSIHDGEKVPIMLVPVIFAATAITHLVGGSAGREGAALQIGGGIGYRVGRLLKLDEKDMRLVTLCGMSAVFAALFGTPLTATIFALEVISVGILYYSGLIPCRTAGGYFYTIYNIIKIKRSNDRSDVDDTVCKRQNYKPRNGDAHADGGQRPFKAHIQKRGNERTRPRSRSGQGYRNENKKPPEAVRLNGLRLFLASVFDKVRDRVEDMVLFHPVNDFSRQQYEKGHGQHIAHKPHGKGRPRIHAGGNADRYRAAYLKYRQHSRNKGFQDSVKHRFLRSQ